MLGRSRGLSIWRSCWKIIVNRTSLSLPPKSMILEEGFLSTVSKLRY